MTVTVTGLGDGVIDGDIVYTIVNRRPDERGCDL